MRTVLLLVSCFFLSSTVEASIEFDSGTVSCVGDLALESNGEIASCSGDFTLNNSNNETNTSLTLISSSILALRDVNLSALNINLQAERIYINSTSVLIAGNLLLSAIDGIMFDGQFIQTNNGNSVVFSVFPITSPISNTPLQSSTGDLVLTSGSGLSLNSGQSGSGIQIPVERAFPAGGTIILGDGSLSLSDSKSTPLTSLDHSASVPLPSTFNILLAGLAFMLFAPRRSPAHKVAF